MLLQLSDVQYCIVQVSPAQLTRLTADSLVYYIAYCCVQDASAPAVNIRYVEDDVEELLKLLIVS